MATTLFGRGVISIGDTASPTDVFECQVSQFQIVATQNTIPIPATHCAGPSTKGIKSSFALALTFMQDWGSTPSLSELLFENDGDELFFTFVPEDVTVPSAAGTFSASAGTYGGEGEGLWVTTANMPMPAAPTLTPPTP